MKMKKFIVEVKEVVSRPVTIVAPDTATREEVIAAVKNGEGSNGQPEYDYDLPSDVWTVRNEIGNYI
jgi:hypothetical protein